MADGWLRRVGWVVGACLMAAFGCGSSAVRPNAIDAAVAATAMEARDAALGESTTAGGGCGTCTGYLPPRSLGPIPAVLDEMSGLAASARHPGLFYAHNDSANTPRFFAIDEAAHVTAVIELPGAPAKDWEAIAVGPCPAGTCIYIADIGDNDLERDDYAVLRLEEPATLPADGSTISLAFERFPLAYPDGRRNAEALLVHPTTGRIFVVTKADAAAVYELPTPLTPDRSTTLVALGPLAIPGSAGMVTDGAIHPCGTRLLIRTKAAAFELMGSSAGDPAALFGASPVQVPLAAEPQGEAATYTIDGLRYLTGGEIGDGQTTPTLNVVDCAGS